MLKTTIYRICIILTLAVVSLISVVQAQDADSLELMLQDQRMPVGERIRVLDDLSWAYMDSDMQRSVGFSKQGLPLALRSKDEKMTATFYRNIGVAYYMGSVYDSARIYLD